MKQEKREFTELEKIYQKAIEDLSRQVAELTVNLSLARASASQMEENEKNNEQFKKAAK